MQSAHIAPAAVSARLEAAGLHLGEPQLAALAEFADVLQRWNRVYNLTGIREPGELIERHLVESLALRFLLRGTRIADVGSGAGLPGLPLAIVEPARQFTLIESRAKRVRFLRHVLGRLRLENVSVEHARAEDVEGPFDTVLARAVAPVGELLAMTRHLTAPGSVLVVATGARALERGARLEHGFALRPVDEALGRKVRGAVLLIERTEE